MALKGVWPPQSDDSDIWDDTALIKAYDKAVASFKVRGRRCRGRILGLRPLDWHLLVFSFLFPKNALKNGECSEPSDKQEQRLVIKRKNHRKIRNRKKSNSAPLKQVASLVHASGAWAACCTSVP